MAPKSTSNQIKLRHGLTEDVSAPEFASIPTTAEFLDVSVATVWRRIADGTLETVKLGGARRVRLRRSLDRLSPTGPGRSSSRRTS